MNVHVVEFEKADRTVLCLLAICKVVVIVATPTEFEHVVRGVMADGRMRRCDLEMRDGRPEPMEEISDDLVVEVADATIAHHGAVTGLARAVTTTNMARMDRLIVNLDPERQRSTPSGIAEVEGVATVIVS